MRGYVTRAARCAAVLSGALPTLAPALGRPLALHAGGRPGCVRTASPLTKSIRMLRSSSSWDSAILCLSSRKPQMF
jgi:hypothetical protein